MLRRLGVAWKALHDVGARGRGGVRPARVTSSISSRPILVIMTTVFFIAVVMTMVVVVVFMTMVMMAPVFTFDC